MTDPQRTVKYELRALYFSRTTWAPLARAAPKSGFDAAAAVVA